MDERQWVKDVAAVVGPEPVDAQMGRAMSSNSDEELYSMLLATAHESPLAVVANCVEILATVLNVRLHDELRDE
jgi:hypothetical protein